MQLPCSHVTEQLRTTVSIDAGSEELATNIGDVLTGVIAMGRMLASDQPEMEFVSDRSRGLSVKAKGSKIAAILECDIEMIELIASEAMGSSKPCDEHDDDDDDDDEDEDS